MKTRNKLNVSKNNPSDRTASREQSRDASTLKFGNLAQVGQRIRAWDFEKTDGRRDRYVEGTVIERRTTCTEETPYHCYVVECDLDTSMPTEYTRVGQTVYVPFGSTFDFEERVELVEIIEPGVLTREDEYKLAAFVCRLSLGGAVDAFVAGMPDGLKAETKEEIAMLAAKTALPIIKRLDDAYEIHA